MWLCLLNIMFLVVRVRVRVRVRVEITKTIPVQELVRELCNARFEYKF